MIWSVEEKEKACRENNLIEKKSATYFSPCKKCSSCCSYSFATSNSLGTDRKSYFVSWRQGCCLIWLQIWLFSIVRLQDSSGPAVSCRMPTATSCLIPVLVLVSLLRGELYKPVSLLSGGKYLAAIGSVRISSPGNCSTLARVSNSRGR